MLGSTVRSLVGESWHELLRTNGQPKSDVCGYCEMFECVYLELSPKMPASW